MVLNEVIRNWWKMSLNKKKIVFFQAKKDNVQIKRRHSSLCNTKFLQTNLQQIKDPAQPLRTYFNETADDNAIKCLLLHNGDTFLSIPVFHFFGNSLERKFRRPNLSLFM